MFRINQNNKGMWLIVILCIIVKQCLYAGIHEEFVFTLVEKYKKKYTLKAKSKTLKITEDSLQSFEFLCCVTELLVLIM